VYGFVLCNLGCRAELRSWQRAGRRNRNSGPERYPGGRNPTRWHANVAKRDRDSAGRNSDATSRNSHSSGNDCDTTGRQHRSRQHGSGCYRARYGNSTCWNHESTESRLHIAQQYKSWLHGARFNQPWHDNHHTGNDKSRRYDTIESRKHQFNASGRNGYVASIALNRVDSVEQHLTSGPVVARL
jgi:hypothetical protein